MRVIGIDPGTRLIGVSILEKGSSKLNLVCSRLLKIPTKMSHPEKLNEIYNQINHIIDEFQPDSAGVEDIFIQKNIRGTFVLGQARGVILLALYQKSVQIHEYAPREIKSAVTGNGNATKSQVAFMVRNFFPEISPDCAHDITDAIGIGLCHFNRIQGGLQ